jgi:hypothetical protein
VVHKPARECPLAEPHPRGSCGIVKARERSQAAADASLRNAPDPG